MSDGGIAAGLSAGSGIIGGISSLVGGNKAASAASDAAKMQQQQYLTTRADLSPYNQAGQSVLPNLTSLANSGATGGGPDYVSRAAMLGSGPGQQQALESTPGYQWQLAQGLQATQSAAAARGLGVSGAALKGAAKFATGLADSNYETQFKNLLDLNTGQQSNLTNQYNRLSGVATLGENAAAQTGDQGTRAAAAAGGFTNQAGQYQAAGMQGVGNALTGAAQNYLGYNALQNMTGQTSGWNQVNYNDSGFNG